MLQHLWNPGHFLGHHRTAARRGKKSLFGVSHGLFPAPSVDIERAAGTARLLGGLLETFIIDVPPLRTTVDAMSSCSVTAGSLTWPANPVTVHRLTQPVLRPCVGAHKPQVDTRTGTTALLFKRFNYE